MGHLAERSFPTLRDPGLNTVQNIKLLFVFEKTKNKPRGHDKAVKIWPTNGLRGRWSRSKYCKVVGSKLTPQSQLG